MNKAIMDRMPATPDVNQERLEQLRALCESRACRGESDH